MYPKSSNRTTIKEGNELDSFRFLKINSPESREEVSGNVLPQTNQTNHDLYDEKFDSNF